MITNLFKTLEENQISPNQIYLLYSLRNGVKASNINVAAELRLLTGTKWLKEGKLSDEANTLLDKLDGGKKSKADFLNNTFRDKVTEYLETFPKMKLPTGKMARSNFSEVADAFHWFFRTYVDKYSWDIILKATEQYVSEYEKNNYMYMRTAKYFIRKQNSDKTWSSDLAEYCENIDIVVENSSVKFKDNVV